MRAHVYAALQTQLFHCPDTRPNKSAGLGEQRESREYNTKRGRKKSREAELEDRVFTVSVKCGMKSRSEKWLQLIRATEYNPLN